MVVMTHEYTKNQMIGLAVGFMFLPIVFYCLRIWARSIIKRITLDDYLAGAALVLSIVCCSLQLAATIHGHLGQHQPQHPDGTAIMEDPGLAFFEKSKFALNMISIVGLGLVKSSILVLYLSLFPNRKFQWVVYCVLGYVIVWTISFFFSHLFTCYPITAFIDFFQDKKCVNQVAMFLTVLYTNVVADFTILVLPIPMVMSVQLKLRKKIAVLGMLSLGAAVCAVSVTRVIAVYAIAKQYVHYPNDIIYYTAPVFFWTNIELSMAVVCACLPTLRPIWRHVFPKETATGNNSYELGYGSARKGGKKGSHNNMPYTELDEMELNAGNSHTRSASPASGTVVKETRIRQTVEPADDSSAIYLPPAESGVGPLGPRV
ncbi:hypothetical protein BN1723_002907 [Verticillium longisporum]|uniref:Rhodopsin domain-containing protein n=1 Tax=Verticillium longisporum TaxID=100787 RepID=A0A0G4L9X5_VERLO|nr:Satratoxin biosynthesis SC1 cluster protein 4 like [Verticillium longisporum]CRK18777.1 hypothetical protein BN1708_003144 [Verticillium longisporum]CRK22469.1 hypothetical protein BN1723_002907 [Verticillium longisporum]